MIWIVPALFAVFAMLMSYVLLRALREADQSYASEYTVNTSRQLEDMFLFISPKQMVVLSRRICYFVRSVKGLWSAELVRLLRCWVSGYF
jgi:hypothetical protein